MPGSKRSTPILVSLLVVSLLFAVYYYVVLPKQDEQRVLQQSVASLEQDIITLQQHIDSQQSAENAAGENAQDQQKKLPLNKDVVNLLLNIEQIEGKSQSKIVNIQFLSYDTLVNESALQDPLQSQLNEQLKVTDEAEFVPITPIAKDTLPPQLQMTTFIIDLESDSEENLSTFLKELETLERIVRIDHVDFSLPGETGEWEETDANLVKAKLQATAFYFEE